MTNIIHVRKPLLSILQFIHNICVCSYPHNFFHYYHRCVSNTFWHINNHLNKFVHSFTNTWVVKRQKLSPFDAMEFLQWVIAYLIMCRCFVTYYYTSAGASHTYVYSQGINSSTAYRYIIQLSSASGLPGNITNPLRVIPLHIIIAYRWYISILL